MYRTRYVFWFLLFALSLTLACGSQSVTPIPSPIPTVLLPTSTSTPLPPTRALATSTREPTPIPPTRPPRDTPTAVIGPLIDLNQPEEGATLKIGSEATVSGYAQVNSSMSIKVGLSSITGWSITAIDAVVENTNWQAALPIPEYVTGAATLHAVIVDGNGEELARKSVPVTLVADGENGGSYLTIFRPTPEAVAVAGHNFFVDGQLWKSGGGFVQIAVLMNDCQENVADFSFNLSSSSYWYGFLTLPKDISGPACAVAWVGEPGESGWRAAQQPITVLHQDDENAKGIMIVTPRTDRRLRGGKPLLVNGVAYNVPGETIDVTLSLDSGMVLAETTAETNRFGYWEVEVPLPGDVEGMVTVEATVAQEATDEAMPPDAAAAVVFELLPASP